MNLNKKVNILTLLVALSFFLNALLLTRSDIILGARTMSPAWDDDSSDGVLSITDRNVGIGTSTPNTLLHIYDETSTSTIYMQTNISGSGSEIILTDNDGAGCTGLEVLNGAAVLSTVTCPDEL